MVYITLQKLVLTRYKQEIIIVQGNKLTNQKNKSYKELLEQLNKSRLASTIIAIYKLLTKDIVITIENKLACTK
jgi:hypothetical protein